MKRRLASVLALSPAIGLCFFLAGCGNSQSPAGSGAGATPEPVPPVQVQGSIDLVSGTAPGSAPGTVARDTQAKVEGWALLDAMAPPVSAIVTVDGTTVAENSKFSPRKDVSDYFHQETGACGFIITFAATGLAPGEHQVQVLVAKQVGETPRPLPRSATLRVLP